MLMMVEKGIRGEVYYTIHRNERTNNKYIKHYDNNVISSVFWCNYFIWLDNVSKASSK